MYGTCLHECLCKSLHLVNFATMPQLFTYTGLAPNCRQYQFLTLCLWLLRYFLCPWWVLIFLASKCNVMHFSRGPFFCIYPEYH